MINQLSSFSYTLTGLLLAETNTLILPSCPPAPCPCYLHDKPVLCSLSLSPSTLCSCGQSCTTSCQAPGTHRRSWGHDTKPVTSPDRCQTPSVGGLSYYHSNAHNHTDSLVIPGPSGHKGYFHSFIQQTPPLPI